MRLHGKSGLVLVGATFGAAASPVAFLSDWNINFTGTFTEVTAKNSTGNRTYATGPPDTSGDFTGFYDDSSMQTYRMARDGLPRNFYLYPDAKDDNQQYWWGTVVVDFSVTSGVGNTVGVHANWKAASAFTEVTGAFTVFPTANISGQGQCQALGGQVSSLQGSGVDGAVPIISVSANIAGQGNASAITNDGSAVGQGAVALVQPIIGVFTGGAAYGSGGYGSGGYGGGGGSGTMGAGATTTVPIVSVTTDNQNNPLLGQGVATAQPSIFTLAVPQYAQPGRVWREKFQHRELQAPPPIALGTVFPGTAFASAIAYGQDDSADAQAQIAVAPAVAAATGAAQAPATTSIPTPAPDYAQPGRTWLKQFHDSQLVSPVRSMHVPLLTEDPSAPAILQRAAGTSGTATVAAFSPPANSLIVVMVTWMFATGASSTLSCKDSNSVSYTQGPFNNNATNSSSTIFTHYYAAAPGSITFTVTCSSTSQAAAYVVTKVLTGAAANQAGAGNAKTTTAGQVLVSTTATASLVYCCGGNFSNGTPTINGSSTQIGFWSDTTSGDIGAAGRGTNATVTPGSITVGWTANINQVVAQEVLAG